MREKGTNSPRRVIGQSKTGLHQNRFKIMLHYLMQGPDNK